MNRSEYQNARRKIRMNLWLARSLHDIADDDYEIPLYLAKEAESRFPFNRLRQQKRDWMMDRPSLLQRLDDHQSIPF